MNMNIHIIKKKILNLINASMNIRRKTYCALNRISFLKHITRYNIVNHLNDALIMWTLILTSVFITITYFIDTNILNEHVHMLGKTGVLFTISSVNFELKQGNEYRAEYILRIPRLSLSPSLTLPLTLSLPLSLSLSLSLSLTLPLSLSSWAI